MEKAKEYNWIDGERPVKIRVDCRWKWQSRKKEGIFLKYSNENTLLFGQRVAACVDLSAYTVIPSIYSSAHLFVCSFIRSFLISFIHSFVCLFVCSFIHLFVHSFVCSFICLFVHSFIHLFVRSHIFASAWAFFPSFLRCSYRFFSKSNSVGIFHCAISGNLLEIYDLISFNS